MTASPWNGPTAYLMELTAFAGFLTAMVLWRRLDRSFRMIGVWLGLLVAERMLSLAVGDTGGAYVLARLWFPLSVLYTMGAIAAMQGNERRRDMFRLVAIGYSLVWIVLMMAYENYAGPPQWTAELHALVLTAAAAFSVVQRAGRARHDLLRDPGFLLSIGLLLFAAPATFLSYTAREWGDTHPAWYHAYWGGWYAVATFAFLILIAGMRLAARRKALA